MTRPPKHYPTDIYAIRHAFDRAITAFLSAAIALESAVSVVVSVGTSTPGSISPKLLDVLREALAQFRTLKHEGAGPECYFLVVGESDSAIDFEEIHTTFATAQLQAREAETSGAYDRVRIEAIAPEQRT